MGIRTFDTVAADRSASALVGRTGRSDWARGRRVSPIGSPAASFLLSVQRRHGNQFVQRLVQPPSGGRPPGPVPGLQPMLRLGSPGDRYERQADLVARRVTSRRPGSGSADHDAGHGAGRDAGRRDRGEAGPSPGLEAGLEASIRHLTGGGRPLGSTAARPMERAFGMDFGRVRVHSDPGSDDVCRRIGARAFTVGDHIFFRRGEQSSAGASGRHVLAHELTHVVQQRGMVPAGGDSGGSARAASTAGAPRNTIQAFWLKRGGKYYWKRASEHKYFKLPKETHSSKKHPGKTPVFVEYWDMAGSNIEIDPQVGDKVPEKKRANKIGELRKGVVEDLVRIRGTAIGGRLLRFLAARSHRKTIIRPSLPPGGPDPETAYFETGTSHVNFRVDEIYDAFDWLANRNDWVEVNWRMMPTDVVLFHELVHAYHNATDTAASGYLDDQEALDPVDIGIKYEEYKTVGLDTADGSHKYSGKRFTENKYRTARKLPLRTTYRVPAKPGVIIRKSSRGAFNLEDSGEGSGSG
jgi:hypothetical protein